MNTTHTVLPLALVVLGLGCAATGGEGASSGDQALTAAQCAAATPWVAWTAYAAGQLVTYGGTTYRCVQGHTSEPGWTPDAVPALWQPVQCAGGGGGGSGGGSGSSSGSGSGSGSGGGSSCDPAAWVYMGTDPGACAGHLGESCGWTTTDESQGYHCQTVSWGAGCEPGGPTCGGGTGGSSGGGSGSGSGSSSGGSSSSSSSSGSSGGSGSGGSTGVGPSFVLSPYKDTSINMNWNTDAITTTVSGPATPLSTDLLAAGGKAITLAFATGECGSENWAGVPGAAMASANVGALAQSGVKYILSTGGAAGSFTCGSDSGFATFVDRWASPGLIGVDFDIEAGQSPSVIQALVSRIQAGHGAFPGLRFSLTIATLANNGGASTAQSLGSGVQDSLNAYGDEVLSAVRGAFGATWPGYVTVDLMVMDYGSPGAGVCVVSGGACQMGQSALQAAYNLHDRWGVPYSAIELTPMIVQNDASGEQFTLQDADTVAKFAIAQGLAGVHYWSYDRDVDCAAGSASATCSSMGGGYAGPHGFLARFLGDGLR